MLENATKGVSKKRLLENVLIETLTVLLFCLFFISFLPRLIIYLYLFLFDLKFGFIFDAVLIL